MGANCRLSPYKQRRRKEVGSDSTEAEGASVSEEADSDSTGAEGAGVSEVAGPQVQAGHPGPGGAWFAFSSWPCLLGLRTGREESDV